ncbi:MAG: hypothetical protein AAB706_02200 [Patescibacteria group bacterium]
MQEIKCRVALSLGGGFEGTPAKVWGTKKYNSKTDKDKPCVFFGLYGLPDFYELWRHRGKKWILWCGSDIRNFINGYWLENGGGIKLCPKGLAKWINQNCENWVENEVEQRMLAGHGITAKVCPSFLGNVEKFEITYKPAEKPKVYASVSGDDFKLYGWDTIERIVGRVPEVDFYLYGSKNWKTKHKNVIIRGRVSKKIMNKETEKMQAGFRPVEFDGCSEIIVKAILRGQYVISRIAYPFCPAYQNDDELIFQLKNLSQKSFPNWRAWFWFSNNLNKFPWTPQICKK